MAQSINDSFKELKMKPLFDNDLRGVEESTLLYKVMNTDKVNEADFYTFEDILSCMPPSRRAFAESVVELYKRMKERDKMIAPIRSSSDLYKVLAATLEDLPDEEFWAVYLDRSHKIKKIARISKGGLDGTLADVRVIFREAVKIGACALMVAHNHPSGNLKPSNQDRKITEEIRKAGKLLNCELLDHLIIGNGGYYSFCDEGLI